MKNKIIMLICIIFSIVVSIIIYNKYHVEKIYLENEYYNNGSLIEVTNLDGLEDKNYVLFTYNSYCTFPVSCETIFKSYMNKYNISFVSMKYEDYKKTDFVKTVKYAPSVIVVSSGKIIAYLDADSSTDYNKYIDINEFESWLNNYIYTEN